MRAIVIDSKKQEIREETLQGETLAALQKIVGGNIDTAFRLFHHACYVDDEGLFNNPDTGFCFDGVGCFAGSGVLVGSNPRGDTVAATLEIEQIKRRTHWIDLRENEHA